MIAAAETNRDLIYFTFNNDEAFRKLEKMTDIIKTMNVSQVYALIAEYSNEIADLRLREINGFGLCEFLSTKFSTNK